MSPSLVSTVQGIESSHSEPGYLRIQAPLWGGVGGRVSLCEHVHEHSFDFIKLVTQELLETIWRQFEIPPTSSNDTPLVSASRGVWRSNKSNRYRQNRFSLSSASTPRGRHGLTEYCTEACHTYLVEWGHWAVPKRHG